MKKILCNTLQADWGPAMRTIAWAVGHAVIIPAAVVIVLAQWLAFTYQRPLAGVLALVPVRKSMTFATTPEPVVDLKTQAYSQFQKEGLERVAAGFGLTADELARIDFAPSPPNLADDEPPARVISPALDAALDQLLATRPVRPAAPLPPAPALAPRRQRRGSKRPQSTA
jgi:hypothetical protein